MKMPMSKNIDIGILFLIILFLGCFPLFFKPWVHGVDPVGYYSWVRSFVIDGNLDVSNEFNYFGSLHRRLSPTGFTYNEYPVGSAFLWSPFFLFAELFARVSDILGFKVLRDGYGMQYVWMVSLGSILYAFSGLILTYKLCRHFFTITSSVLAVASIWLSSPLVFYMYSHPVMSHANDFFAYSLLLFVWYKTDSKTSHTGAAMRGAAAGLCAFIRQQNAIFIFFLLGEYIIDGIKAYRRGGSLADFRSTFFNIAVFSASWWLVFSPQMIVWKVVYGQWLVWNPYVETVNLKFDWLNPHLTEVLFSTDRGLFVWSPILLLSSFGLLLFTQKNARFSLLIIVNLCIQIYVVSSWPCWNGAVSFGPRLFINMLPGFMLGYAAFVDGILKNKPTVLKWLKVLCIIFVVWNVVLIARYALGDVPRSGVVPIDTLILGQFTAIPRYFERIIQIIVTRS